MDIDTDSEESVSTKTGEIKVEKQSVNKRELEKTKGKVEDAEGLNRDQIGS